MRVAFLTNIVSPYRAPVLRRLGATEGWDLRVLCCAHTESDRRWQVDTHGIEVEVVPTWTYQRRVVSRAPVPFDQTIALHVPHGLWRALARFKPDVVIAHELGPRSAIAAGYAFLHGIPLVIWSYQSRVSASQGAWRKSFRHRLLGRAQAVVGMGTQAREVLEGWGVEPWRVVDAPNAADHEDLRAQQSAPGFADRTAALRQRLGAGRRVALVCGRLVPLKGVEELLALWQQLSPALRQDWRLVFAGSGPQRELVDAASGADVLALGEVSTGQLAALYTAADLHVFPSLGDVWGLVVNEASHCGTPTLCSRHAGCCEDLIQAEENGLVFDPTEPASALEALAAALRHPDLEGLGARAREHAKAFSLDRLADGFRVAVRRALHAGGAHVAA